MAYISRLTVLKTHNKVILGRDLGGVFDEGIIYGVMKVDGVIMLTELGKGATSKPDFEYRRIGQILVEGVYLLTEEEYKAQLKKQED